MRLAIIAHVLRVAGGLSVGQNLNAAFARVAPEHHYGIAAPPGVDYRNIYRAVLMAMPRTICVGEGMRLGIDATNIRSGGGVTHRVELLRATDPSAHGCTQSLRGLLTSLFRN